MSARGIFFAICWSGVALLGGLYLVWPGALWLSPLLLLWVGLGTHDLLQTRHTIRRNFPVLGRLRYAFEAIRPEMQQYFVESNTSGRPFSREQRSLVYQRAKNVTDTLPFGTEQDVYSVGYQWMNHSLCAIHPSEVAPRLRIGGPACSQPYDAAVLNVSAMSYGALSRNAILALNRGAKLGGFYHNTGEGGLSPYHLEGGGDICWQIGTGYFGCRDEHGNFDRSRFAEKAKNPQIKLIEIKLSQGAKPGHGGILPAAKVTPEIAATRGIPVGVECVSPASHSA